MTKKQEPWISANEAAEIISENSGRPVHPDYVRLVARQKPKTLASKPVDGRTNVYLRSDVEKIVVRAKKANRQRQTESSAIDSSEEGKPVTEEQPWYLPEKEESIQPEGKAEPDAA
jgi:hypothetical protein